MYRARMAGPSGVSTEVALKVLRRHGDDGQAAKRMRDEGRMLSRLDHPAIVKVHDLVVLEGRLALVTELIDGQPLAGCLSGPDPLPPKALLEAVARTAEALDAAWSALRLVHRDIKPSNLFVSRHGEVRVLDFGLARSDEVTREAHTRSDLLVGSPSYMAPERFVTAEVLPASDIYSLGATLYEGLAHQRLSDLPVPVAVAVAVAPERHAAFVADRLGRLEGDPDLVALLREMLAFDPSSRPVAADLPARCDALAARAQGSSLGRWCRERVWPDMTETPGELSGRTIVEGDVVAPARRGRIPWRSLAAAGSVAVAMFAGMGLALAAVGWWARDRPPPSVVVLPTPVLVRDPPPTPSAIEPAPPALRGAAPAPAPAPVPDPVPDPVTPARVLQDPEGEGTLSLVGPHGTFPPGDVPPGDYQLVVHFPNLDAPLTLARVLEPGRTYVVKCSARLFGCDVK